MAESVQGLVDGLAAAASGLVDLAAANLAAAELVARRSEATAPRDTGRLSQGTVVRADDFGGTVTNTQLYALPVHAGWQRGATVVAARPWVAAAAVDVEDRVLDVYTQHATDQIGKV